MQTKLPEKIHRTVYHYVITSLMKSPDLTYMPYIKYPLNKRKESWQTHRLEQGFYDNVDLW